MIRRALSRLNDPHLKEVLSGSVVAFIFRILSYAVGYVFIFLVSARYGTKGMGIYSLATSLLVFLEMFGTLGMSTSVLKFAGEFIALSNFQRLKSLYVTILKIVVPNGVVLAAILYALSWFISVRLFHDTALTGALKLTSFLVPFSVLTAINIELIRGAKKIKFSEFLRNVTRPMIGIAALLLISKTVENSYYLPLIAFGIGTVVTWLLSQCLVHGYLSRVSAEKSVTAHELLSVSVPMMMTAFSFLIMGRIDTLMVGFYCSVEEVGIYSVALKLASAVSFILVAVNTIAAPKFAELYSLKDYASLNRVVRLSSKLAFAFSLPLLLVLVFFPRFMLQLLGRDFEAGSVCLLLLAAGQFVNCASGSVGHLLNMTGGQKAFRNIIFAATGANILLNFFLIPRFGINGAAVSTMTSVMLWNILSVVHVRRTIKINTFYFPLITK